jgi:hypothetical protein
MEKMLRAYVSKSMPIMSWKDMARISTRR